MKKVKMMEELIFKYFQGSASVGDISTLSSWLDQSRSNKQVFATLKKVNIEIEANASHDLSVIDKSYNKFLKHINAHENLKDLEKKIAIKNRRKNILRYAAMIAIVMSIATGAFFIGHGFYFSTEESYNEIEVPYGGRSNIILPDGSEVWLNAGSKLKYSHQFGNKKREVFLVGEAFFDVEKSKHSFIVHTSDLDIHVLGTSFNVKSYPDEDRIETTLIEGIIRIEREISDQPVYLKPKEKLTFRKSSNQVSVQSAEEEKVIDDSKEKNVVPDKITPRIQIFENVNTEESISWKEGDLIFNKEPLENLAKKLARKYDIRIEFTDEKLKKYSYSGTLRDFPLEQVLKALELTSPVKYTIEGKIVKLSFNRNFKPLTN
jgi:ferric-dicitrate binding protein FerR (iron transport regulator)